MNTFTLPNDSNPESVDRNVVDGHSSSPTISNPATATTAAPAAAEAEAATAMTHGRGEDLAPAAHTTGDSDSDNDSLKPPPPSPSPSRSVQQMPAPKKQKCDHEKQWQQQSIEGFLVPQKQATMREIYLVSKVKELQDEKAKLEATVQSLQARIRELESTSTDVELPAEHAMKRKVCVMRGVTKDQAIDIDREDYEAICNMYLPLFFAKMRSAFAIRDDDKERRIYSLRLSDSETIENFFSHPAFAAKWNKLTDLHLCSLNYLPSSLGLLTNLTSLLLLYSKIDSLPPAIGQLKNLRELDLDWSESLSDLPQEIGDLSSLIRLDLSNTGIKSLPSSIGRLQNLERLGLCATSKLTNLPQEIGNLSSLEFLYLNYSNISSLPSSIGRLQNLKRLDLPYTQHLSSLPREFGNLSSLKVLVLSHSKITSLPPSIGKLQNLERLELSYTEQLSSLPREFGDLKSLKVLGLYKSGVRVSWQWPHPIGRLTSLRHLFIGLRDETQPENKQACEFLMKLVLQCKVLGRIYFPTKIEGGEILEYRLARNQKLEYHLAWNRAKWRMGFVKPKFWPLVIQHPKHAFDKYTTEAYFFEEFVHEYVVGPDCMVEYDSSDLDSDGDPDGDSDGDPDGDSDGDPDGDPDDDPNIESSASSEADDIYRLLVCGRESFIQVLLDRNKKVAGTGI